MAVLKKLTNEIRISSKRPTTSRKGAAAGRNKGIGTQHYAPIERIKDITSLMPVLIWHRIKTSARPVGKSVCDGVGSSARPSIVNLNPWINILLILLTLVPP